MSRLNRAPRSSPLAAVSGPPPAPAGPSGQAEPVDPGEVKKKQSGFWICDNELDRVRAAQANTALKKDGYPSISEFIRHAVLAEAERLERAHNQGEPWDPIPANKVKHSRRTT